MLKLLLSLIAIQSIFAATTNPCLGEYEFCPSSQSCVLISADCDVCSKGQHLCPDRVTCVNNVASLVKCPNVAGTHYDWTLDIESRLDYLIAQTSLAERVSQLQNDAPAIANLSIPSYNWLNEAIHGVCGEMGCGTKTPQEIRELRREKRRLNGLLGFRDVGPATSFPDGCGLGGTWNPETISRVGTVIGVEYRAKHNGYVHSGIRYDQTGLTTYAPNMNLVKDPRWGRSMEVYSEDPHLSSRLTVSFVTGMQQGNDPNYLLCGSCCKHYSAYDVENLPNGTIRLNFSANIDSRNFWETQMPVFRACVVEAEASSVMCSYNSLNGVPTCGNKDLLNGVLRDRWDWDGFVVSDYDSVAFIKSWHHYVDTYVEAISLAMNSGCDQEGGGDENRKLPEAIAQGLVPESAVNDAFRRLFRIRIRLGMLDPPTKVTYNSYDNSTDFVESIEHTQMARNVAQESIALLQNNNNALPLNQNKINTIALIGPEAVGKLDLLGNYNGYPATIVSVLEAFQSIFNYTGIDAECKNSFNLSYIYTNQTASVIVDEVGDCCNACWANPNCNFWTYEQLSGACFFSSNSTFKQFSQGLISGGVASTRLPVLFAPGCADPSCSDTSQFDEAASIASMADAVIFLYGLGPDLEGEGHDRVTMSLPGFQPQLLKQLRTAAGSNPLVGVLIHGGSLTLASTTSFLDAIIDAYYPGMQGGPAIADVIMGDYNPGGRTTQTWYWDDSQLPPMESMDMYELNGRTYRFFQGKVTFPFGFGLSYTTFSYSNITASPMNVAACAPISLSVLVTNTGTVAGDEVVQVYAAQETTVPGPRVRLVGFKRIHLRPAQSRVVEFVVLPRDRYVVHDADDFWDVNDLLYVESGTITFSIGGGQPDYYPNHLSIPVQVVDTQPLVNCENPW